MSPQPLKWWLTTLKKPISWDCYTGVKTDLSTSQQKTCFQKVYVFVLSSKPNNGFFNSKMSIRAHSVQCKEGQDLLREEFEEIGHYTLNRSLSGMNLKVPP
jgi:hypothetical protein